MPRPYPPKGPVSALVILSGLIYTLVLSYQHHPQFTLYFIAGLILINPALWLAIKAYQWVKEEHWFIVFCVVLVLVLCAFESFKRIESNREDPVDNRITQIHKK
jgi:uncharacterized membrane protein